MGNTITKTTITETTVSQCEATCHWCDKKVTNPVYYSTKLVNEYGLPVSFCQTCVPELTTWDTKAIKYND